MDLSRRRLLTGLIAAPAVLKLGILMPVKVIKPVIIAPSWERYEWINIGRDENSPVYRMIRQENGTWVPDRDFGSKVALAA